MKLKLDKSTKRWALMLADAVICAGDGNPILTSTKEQCDFMRRDPETVESVLVTVTRVPKKARRK